jgi:hypothetical protein
MDEPGAVSEPGARAGTAAADLAALEEIRRVKYRYLRCVDLKQWDELAGCFTTDATAYRVSARTSFGTTSVSVPQAPAAANVITASDSSGDIRIVRAKAPAVPAQAAAAARARQPSLTHF